jgi:hypothetical protein
MEYLRKFDLGSEGLAFATATSFNNDFSSQKQRNGEAREV